MTSLFSYYDGCLFYIRKVYLDFGALTYAGSLESLEFGFVPKGSSRLTSYLEDQVDLILRRLERLASYMDV